MSCSSPKYEELQHQLNRLLDGKGMELLKIDGVIGKNTIQAVYVLTSSSKEWGTQETYYASCEAIAKDAAFLTAAAKMWADALGYTEMVMEPMVFEPKIRKPQPSFDPKTNTFSQPSMAQAKFMGLPLWMLALGVGGGIWYWKKGRK